MGPLKKIGTLSAVLALVAVGAWLVSSGRLVGAVEADAPVAAETAPVVRMDIGATVLATGVVRPRVGAEVAVGSRVSGVPRRLHVTVGDRVQAGQLLAELAARIQALGGNLLVVAAERAE